MAFSDLSTELQDIILQNYSDFAKWLVFASIVFLSVFYIFQVWKNQTKTPYILVAISRVFFLALSVATLFGAPLMLLNMSPEYSFYDFYILPLTIYGVFVAIALVLVFVDLIRYGPMVLLSLSGIDFGDKNVRNITKQIKNGRHFLKYGRR